MIPKRYLLVITLALAGLSVTGIVFATTPIDGLVAIGDAQFQDNIIMLNGSKKVQFVTDNISMTRETDSDGSFLVLRGFTGIKMKTGSGNGIEQMRVSAGGVDGLNMKNNKRITYNIPVNAMYASDSSGGGNGNYMHIRGYEGIVFGTGGLGTPGSQNEQMRITNTGNIELDSGDIISSGPNNMIIKPNGDICIGSGC